MMVLITYDVKTTSEDGTKRLRQVSKQCQNYGQRVQNSVFECLITPTQLKILQGRLLEIINPETDSLRYYTLGKNWKNHVLHVGAKKSLDLEGPLIV